MSNQESFSHKLWLTIIDKLLIGCLIVLASLGANLILTRFQINENIKIENLKDTLIREREEYKQEFLLYRDQISRESEKSQRIIENQFKADREDINRREKQAFEERLNLEQQINEKLIRKEQQFLTERTIQIQNQHDMAKESFKNNNNFNALLMQKYVESISLVWGEINKINIGSRMIQNKLKDLDGFRRENLDQPLKVQKQGSFFSSEILKVEKEQQKLLLSMSNEDRLRLTDEKFIGFLDELDTPKPGEYIKIDRKLRKLLKGHRDKISRDILYRDTLYAEYLKNNYLIQLWKNEFKNLSENEELDIYLNINKDRIKDLFQQKFYNYLGVDIDDLFEKVGDAEILIQENYLWINDEQREKMEMFLSFYIDYLSEYPFLNTEEQRNKLNKDLDLKRQTIFDLRKIILKNLDIQTIR